ncbi:MAG: tRNA (adenosine(37)-N6)-threonylcarbamoyltransferase complex ATPase subunit type 1 TsaE [Clostridia bacterium]|nr:tRNA (adenosine(37)-N6)-threonylcarbamoyltransferase complex ATPase subunit type 1 TsaE [Clostridia bacterium]
MRQPLVIETHSARETEAAGAALARDLLEKEPDGAVVALSGDLGVGKTAFARGAGTVLAPDACVQSPTYTLVRVYGGPGRQMIHFDLYRIQDEDDLLSVGFYDYLEEGNFLFIEWSERVPQVLPERFYRVEIERTGEPDGRRIRITGPGEVL